MDIKTRWNVALIDRRGLTCSTTIEGKANDAFRWLERKVDEAHDDTDGFTAMPAVATIVTISGAHFTAYTIDPETGHIEEVR